MNQSTNLKILKELHKGAQMGMNSIYYVSEKIKDDQFKNELSYQNEQYTNILNKVNQLYTKYNEVPSDGNLKDEMMVWMGVQMNTMNNTSTSKISELLIQGTNMGIIEGRKLLNHNPDTDEEIKNVLNEFVSFQENNVEKLKTFL